MLWALCGAMVFGVAIGERFCVAMDHWFGIGVLLALSALALWPRSLVRRACLAVAVLVVGLCRAADMQRGWDPLFAPEPQGLYIARIEGPSRRPCVEQTCRLLQRAQILARWEAASASVVPRHAWVWFAWPFDPALAHGDVVLVRLALAGLDEPRQFWQASQQELSRHRHVTAHARLLAGPALLSRGKGAWSWIDRIRLLLCRRFDQQWPPHIAALAKAFALGDAYSLSQPDRDAFADAGIAHLLAVSGMHVAIVARFVLVATQGALAFCPFVLCPRRLAALFALVFVWGYAALAGMGTAIVRAAIMATLVLGTRACGLGTTASLRALAVAAAIIAWRSPRELFAASTLLSFVCVAALLTLTTFPTRRSSSVLERCARMLYTSLLATLASWPIVASVFGRISLLAPLSNLIAIPVATLVATPLTLLYAALSLLAPAQGSLHLWLGHLCALAISSLRHVAHVASSFPWAAWPTPAWSKTSIFVWLFAWAMTAGVMWIRRESRFLRPRLRSTCAFVLGCLAACFCATALLPVTTLPIDIDGKLCLVQLDVGQGEATLLHMPNGQWVLIDAGGATTPYAPDPGRTTVLPALQAFGIKRLALVVITHPHPDHIGGLSAILRAMPVDALVYNKDAARHTLVLQWQHRRHALGQKSGAPSPVYHFGEAVMRVVQARTTDARSSHGENNRSLVTSLTLGDHKLLLTGDIEEEAEQELLHLGQHDLLQVAHHGSKTSSHAAFLDAVAPRIALLSCSMHNRFGHPDDSVCARLQERHILTRSTAKRGTMTWCTDGRRWTWHCAQGGDCGHTPDGSSFNRRAAACSVPISRSQKAR